MSIVVEEAASVVRYLGHPRAAEFFHALRTAEDTDADVIRVLNHYLGPAWETEGAHED